MDAKGISSVRPRGITTALVYAVLEWLLLSMLFVDAIFAFIITKYALYNKLQTPCLLCSRLDHVLGREKRGYYWDLICGNHKQEISSLVICHAHNKLVDVHQICESCLSSFATTSRSNAEKCRLLEGKLWDDHDSCCDQTTLLEGCKSSSGMNCSCCSEPLISGRHAQQLIQAKSIVFEAAELDVLSSDAAVGSTDNEMQLTKNDQSVSLNATPVNSGFDPLSHIGYSEHKVASDPESEVLFLHNDEATAIDCETDNPKDLQVQCVQLEPLIVTLAEDSSSEKLIDQAFVIDPSVLEPQVQPLDSCGALPAASTVSNDNDLKELNGHQVEEKSEPSTLHEIKSFDLVPPSSNSTRPPVEVSNESLNVTTSAIEQTSVLGSEKVCDPETVAVTRTSTSNGPQLTNLLDLGDAYKVALESKGKQLTDVLAEQWTERNSSKVTADFKRLLSQLSAARGFDQSIYDISPRLSNYDEIKPTDLSNSIGMHIFQKRISLERNESGLSLDGSIVSIVSEVDGESLVDRLRRQIEHDRKSMSVLYKELEEERNASAIAANQAMAMITKLQEEKAALNMEASQYLRMMEEQSEYDSETLQKLTDLLAEKERQIQDLEEEIEFYKRKYPNESTMENIQELSSDCKLKNVEHSEVSKDRAAILRNSIAENELTGDQSMSTVANSLLEFEDESSYILHSLKKLEMKLFLFSNNGVHSDLDGNEELKEVNSEGGISGRSQYAEEQSLPSTMNLKLVNKKNDDLICGGNDLATIRSEIYDLNDRLRALEADWSFLEHAINSLRNGNEGLQFIQEIASHLREIRKIGMNRRDQSLTQVFVVPS